MNSNGFFTPFSFLNSLHLSEQQSLKNIAHSQIAAKNDYIFRAGDLNDELYVLLEGRVKITRLSQQGREFIQWFCLPGEIFGLAEDNNTQDRRLYAQALTNTKSLRIKKIHFERYLLNNPRVSLLIVKQLSNRLHSLGDMLLNATSEDASARFIGLLQQLSKLHGQHSATGIYVDFYLTHQEMANMIGVCRQTVSSMISHLKQNGMIDTNRRGIHIKNPTALFQQDPTATIRIEH